MTLFLHDIRIGGKIWAGFSVVLFLLAAISVLTMMSLGGVRKTIHDVVENRQPTALLSIELSRELQRTARSFGFYLLTKEESDKAEFLAGERRSGELMQALSGLSAVASDETARAMVEEISSEFAQLRGVGEEILAITTEQEANFPGIAYANASINPLSREGLQLLATMLMAEEEEEYSEERRALAAAMADLRYTWANIMNGVRGYLAFRRAANIDDTQLYLQRSDELIAGFEEYDGLLNFEQEESFARLKAVAAEYKANFATLLGIHGSERWRTDTWLVKSKVDPLFSSIESRLQQLVTLQKSGIESASSALMEDADAASSSVLTLLVVGLLLGTVVAFTISRAVVKPLREAVAAMDEIADGDGDLTRRLNRRSRDEIGMLCDAFNRFVNRVQDIVSQTSSATSAVIGSVSQTAEITTQITRDARRQEAETVQIATSISQMAASIAEVTTSAVEAESATSAAQRQAELGREVIAESTQSVQSLAADVERAAATLSRLEADAESIGSVLDVIKSIAEQTNLLALNAAIEAARAGEQGRGFAVVADEVRNLANRTQKSTGEIESMILRLREAAHDAVSAMEVGRGKAETNVAQATRARETFDSISTAVEIINRINTETARASSEQKRVVEEVARNIQSVRDGSQSTSSRSQQSAVVTEQLGALAAELQKTIGQFRICGDVNFDFNVARSAHLAWRARLRAFLDGRESLSQAEAVSHRECVLGKWYYQDGLKNYSELPAMKRIESPHAELHKTVAEIIRLKHEGETEQAEALYRRIDALSQQIVGLLDEVEREVRGSGRGSPLSGLS